MVLKDKCVSPVLFCLDGPRSIAAALQKHRAVKTYTRFCSEARNLMRSSPDFVLRLIT